MSLLNFNLVMIYIIHKMLVLFTTNLNYLAYSIFECFLKEYNKMFTKYNNGNINSQRRKHDLRYKKFFQTKKKTKLHCN